MKKILIIGASSESGKYLFQHIKKEKSDIFFCDISKSYNSELDSRWFESNLTDYDSMKQIIASVVPDQIYNFAGSFSNIFDTDYIVNVLLTKNIFDAIIELKLNSRILLVGSAAEYGAIDVNENPVNENHPLNPVSIYGLTKVYQTNLMKFYHRTKNINVVMARTFNLISSNMSEKLFIGRLYKQIDEYKKGVIEKISLGNLQNKRDYIDIDEAVKKYSIIMEKGFSGEVYNVGSGKSITISELLEDVLKRNDLTMDCVGKNNFDNRFDIKDVYADVDKLYSLEEL